MNVWLIVHQDDSPRGRSSFVYRDLIVFLGVYELDCGDIITE